MENLLLRKSTVEQRKVEDGVGGGWWGVGVKWSVIVDTP